VQDTGVDATHPDLAGKVAEKADFTTENGDAGDRFGHGTHVAATIAGSGVASDGERRGVAPDAHLVIGKVLDDQGSGTDSQVIAGMQWAAQRAPVINMSLGGWDASDGSDPLSQAVDALTKQTGALFVIAAGNSGPGEASISSPGAAATALTVGAVNADDKLADFSSRGPLVTTRAAKPEIVAPGVEIVEARAASTSMGRPIDGRYTAASGTSMATPHVAGAAANLAQTHPGWHAAQIKAALVGAAHPLPSAQAYDAGAGRLDIPHALVGTVSNQAVVNLGTFSYPQDGTAETKLAWTNSATTAATLTLGITLADRHGVAGPKNAAKLSNTSLVVPAGATGSTSLLIDRSKFGSRPGLYAAVVTARAGSNTITTPVAFYVEPPSFDLAVSAAALPDTPADSATAGVVEVTNIDDQVLYADYVDVEPDTTTTFRVPAGRYSVMGQVYDLRPDGSARRTALAGDPDVAVNADTAVVLDGAAAKPVTATVDGVATEPTVTAVAYVQTPRRGYAWYDEVYAFGDDARNNTVYAAPASAGAGVGSFQPYEVFALDTPGDGPSPYQYDLIRTLPGTIPDNPAYRVTAADQARLARIDQRFSRLNLPGTATGHQRYGLTPDGALIGETDSRNVPATRTDYVSPGIQWSDEAFYDGVIEYGVVTEEPFHAYAAGSRQQKVWVRQPLRPDWYDDAALALSSCTPTPVSRTREMLHVQLVDLTDQHQRFDCLGDGDTWTDKTTRTLTLYADGKRVGEHDDSFGDFTIPRKAATYRLTYDLDASALLPVSTRVSTAWTFHSTGPNGTGNAAVPLLSVDYALPLDEANQPTDGMAAFTVRQTQGVTAQQITSLNLWTSTDDGVTWQSTRVQKQVGDRFTAALAQPAAGQPVSLRVSVTASGGSKFEQTIIRAC
jgi:hypothetical protein